LLHYRSTILHKIQPSLWDHKAKDTYRFTCSDDVPEVNKSNPCLRAF